MKIDEEDIGVGLDREDAFQTDDEENRAERVCGHAEDDTESDFTFPSRNSSNNFIGANNSNWPQSYRESMDMLKGATPQSLSFLKISGVTGSVGSTSSTCKYPSLNDEFSSLGNPLVFEAVLDEEAHTPNLIASQQSISINGSIPPLENQCSFIQALINGINVLSGIGLLTTPYAVKEGGWLSLTLLVIFGIVACYTGVLLKRCLESSPGLQTYPDIGQAAFGVAGRLMISVILYAELYAACVEYVIMMSDNLSTIFPNTGMHFAGIYLDAPQVFAIIGTLFILPTVWLRDLSLLSYLSVGGVGASILMVLCLLWIGVDHAGFHQGGTSLNLSNLPISVGIYSFCYAGHSVFPNIYSSMREPSQFPFVLIGSFTFCWILSTGIAISGFLIFGDSVESQFTLNMPTNFLASKVAICTVVIITISKYALTLTPIALSLEELISSTWFRSYGVSILIRTALVISTLIVAMKVPFFAFVMALAGSLLAMLITVVFPCACYLSILGDRLSKLQITVCICIGVLGLIIAGLGTYASIIRIAGQLGDIIDNTLLAQELVRDYNRKNISPRCSLKIDLHKAFDSLHWGFISATLKAIGLPSLFINWIELCFSTARYSIAFNGSLIGYFKGAKVGKNLFAYHPKCKRNGITHLSFADDLLIFCKGTVDSFLGVTSVLDMFYEMSGLKLNASKCELFAALRYLGIPLVTRKISDKDCVVLIENIKAKLHQWSTKTLSYVGRLELKRVVLFSITNYWCRKLFLPLSVLKKVEQLCSRFFWKGSDRSAFGARVSWQNICCLKSEGGLGIKDLKTWNRACMLSLIKKILAGEGSLWVAWLKSYILKENDFWNAGIRPSVSWSLKKIFKLRPEAFSILSPGAKSVRCIWDSIWVRHPLVTWQKLIWFPFHIPKHSLITWMAFIDRLPTKARLLRMGLINDSHCMFCENPLENRDHLFLHCPMVGFL
ncbi:lectin-like protein [Hibiscus syriacus]|uniref:Lectin-like protein n=1 Tax=Hibiscus syriacus TaxID=106335 RepID=A0A6A2Z618_HIBSY|nr:lectin-like protein [Hibiscus syriacus]